VHCLYRSDYGPPDPAFHPDAHGGVFLHGFASDGTNLIGAQNLGQLKAIKRQLARGEHVQWCDQGYGWTYQPRVEALFDGILILVVAPWFVWRVVGPALRWARRRIRDRAAVVKAMT
jgi:hypothetical protein